MQASNDSVNAQISTLKTEISHLQTLNGQLTTTTPVYGRFGRVVGTTTNVMAGARAEYTRNVAEIKTLTDKVNGMQSAQDAANTAQKQLSLMQQTGTATAGQLSLANRALKLANDNVTSATKGSLGALNNLIGGQLSAEQSSLGWAQDLASLGQSLSTNGSSIDLNTTAGQNNRQALDQVATAIDNQITQLVNQHASIKTINGVLQGHITQLQGVASQYGLSSGAVDAYLAQLHLTPSQVDTTLIQHGYTHAINQVKSLKNTIAALHDKTITVDVNGVYAGVTGTPGNPLPGTHAYARGGIVTNTPTFLVGEDGSGYPEWVIPTNPQHRGNALNLLGSLHKALGFASGGTIGQVPSFVGPQVTAGGALAMSLLGLDYGGNIGSMAGSVNGLSASTSASITAVGHSAANAAVAAAIASAAASAAASASSGGGGPVAALGQSMAAARGWTGPLWTDLNNVANYESGWSMTAKNPLSGAYGIAQFINGPSEYAQYGGNATTATGQITGFLNYIASRYGTPAGAWNHELNFSNYGTGGILGKSKDKALPFQVLDKGGFLPPGLSMAFNGLGAPEPVGAAIGATGNPKVVVHSTVVVQSDLAESTYSKVVALQHQSEDRIVKLIEGAFE